MVLVQVFVPAVAVTVRSPAAEAVRRPCVSTVPPAVDAQVTPENFSGFPSLSRVTALSWSVEPTRTSAGAGVTSHDATWLAAAEVRQAPPMHDWPLPHCVSLPQAGERQTPSSQTLVGVAAVWHSEVWWQMLTQAELRQTWLPLQSASVVQAMGPESGGPLFPLLHAERA